MTRLWIAMGPRPPVINNRGRLELAAGAVRGKTTRVFGYNPGRTQEGLTTQII